MTMRAPAWEPIAGKLQLVLSGEAGASKAAFPSRSLGTSENTNDCAEGTPSCQKPFRLQPIDLSLSKWAKTEYFHSLLNAGIITTYTDFVRPRRRATSHQAAMALATRARDGGSGTDCVFPKEILSVG